MTGILRSIHEKHDYETKLHSFEKVSCHILDKGRKWFKIVNLLDRRERKKSNYFCFAEEHKIYLVVSWFMLGYEYGKFGREKRRQYDGF